MTDKTWSHLNFFQHHCYITAKIPRVHYKAHRCAWAGWSGVKDELPKANVTLDWFHVVHLFTRAVDDDRKTMTCKKLFVGRC
ncbi:MULTISPECIES: transposase [Vibrio]|uniref:transposase n=1 Tax=Vibrio TaxID=662 RepID=UPI001302F402|nr:transposase [Vibrio alginolyticus]MDK9728820.1 transposase [Vibrio sp. D415a]MDK9745029.1 transposase [Vibrio sp. D409a]MDK9765982.1 transposase [Vibrio sp. D417a]MDK9786589.1 transposase [Vibrio sp. D421a]